jgi:hypothetical protein
MLSEDYRSFRLLDPYLPKFWYGLWLCSPCFVQHVWFCRSIRHFIICMPFIHKLICVTHSWVLSHSSLKRLWLTLQNFPLLHGHFWFCTHFRYSHFCVQS